LVNLHFSLLPAYKGCWTSVLPILHGETRSGVTLHLIDPGIDTGPIIDQTAFVLDAEETAFGLYQRYTAEGVALVERNLDAILAGAFSARPQPLEGSSHYGRKTFDPGRTEIDPRLTAEQIDRFVRALYFPAYQTATWAGRPVDRVSVVAPGCETRIGTVSAEGADFTDLQCIDAVVRLRRPRAGG